jgi:hypothetical protein
VQENQDMTDLSTFPLRLPRSLKTAAEVLAKEDGVSLNQFIAVTLAEKIGAMQSATFLAERRRRANLDEFRAILTRKPGRPPGKSHKRQNEP